MLCGTAVNQDGRSSALTAPHGPSQQQVMRSCLLASEIDACSVQVLQMHGTGTPLGDPIEVGAASAVLLSDAQARTFPVHMSAVKSNIGHTEAAAGMAGMVQLTGALMNKSNTAITHLRHVNPHIVGMLSMGPRKDAGSLGIDLSRESSALSCPESCVGGVSAFAFQGTNAHVVLSHRCGSGDESDCVSRPNLSLWQHERCWYVCRLPKVLSHVHYSQGADISLEAVLNTAQSASLWQQVYCNKPMTGLGALMEMCLSTLDVLKSSSKGGEANSSVLSRLAAHSTIQPRTSAP